VIRALFRGLKSLIRKLLKLGAVVGAVMFLVRLFTRRSPAHDTETVTSGAGPSSASSAGSSSASSSSLASTGSSASSRVSASVDEAASKTEGGSSGDPGSTASTAPSAETAVDTAETETAAWVTPDEDGACPASHPVKVKVSSGIYHVPGGTAYARTTADRCYVDAAAAEADGYRPSKR
jgi:cytoskeletal protein RodZ